ncbi:MAG: NUDIX domain-containing protein [Pontibacterium sp.]
MSNKKRDELNNLRQGYKNPWQTQSKRPIYDNPWINIEEHAVITPAGTEGIYGVVSFKNTAVGVVPIDDEGYTWLVGQWRYVLNDYSWEIPEGGCPQEEAPAVCALRELKEETGLSAEVLQPLMRIHPSNSVCTEDGHLFVATGLSQGDTEHEDTEDISVRRIHLDEAIDMAMQGDITDSLSLAALFKIAALRSQWPATEDDPYRMAWLTQLPEPLPTSA